MLWSTNKFVSLQPLTEMKSCTAIFQLLFWSCRSSGCRLVAASRKPAAQLHRPAAGDRNTSTVLQPSHVTDVLHPDTQEYPSFVRKQSAASQRRAVRLINVFSCLKMQKSTQGELPKSFKGLTPIYSLICLHKPPTNPTHLAAELVQNRANQNISACAKCCLSTAGHLFPRLKKQPAAPYAGNAPSVISMQ